MTYVDLRDTGDERLVYVDLGNGAWAEGWLEAYRKDDGGWTGWVRYSVGVGQTHLGWFTEDRIWKNPPGTVRPS